MSRSTMGFASACLFIGMSATAHAGETVAGGRRVAVVVGANAAAPGRAPLRYAYEDASSVAGTLTDVAGFSPSDVNLLRDPDPEQLLATIDRSLREAGGPDGLFLFYYSGHADGRAVYPQGKALSFSALRERIDNGPAQVRLGILDACRGGGWTHAKGLDTVAAFDVEMPVSLASEGSVLIASSSGLESSHESDVLHGSFFTHYLVAAMRGAADGGGDGEVTLAEAFEYAKTLTARDTSLVADEPQHPSFEINLRGRRDLPLSRISRGRSLVALEQVKGPLQLVQMESGIVVIEVAPGPRAVRLAVAPGWYVVRRKTPQGILAAQIEVRAGEEVSVREEELTLVGLDYIAAKQMLSPRGEPVRSRRWQLSAIPFYSEGGGNLGAEGTYYLQPLVDDPNYPLEFLAFAQRTGSVSFGSNYWWRANDESDLTLSASALVFPWASTGLSASVSVASTKSTVTVRNDRRRMNANFAVGLRQYLGSSLQLHLDYSGMRALSGSGNSEADEGSLGFTWVGLSNSVLVGADLGLSHSGEKWTSEGGAGVFSDWNGSATVGAEWCMNRWLFVGMSGRAHWAIEKGGVFQGFVPSLELGGYVVDSLRLSAEVARSLAYDSANPTGKKQWRLSPFSFSLSFGLRV